MIDLCSRKVVGRPIAGHMHTALATDAIEMAVAARSVPRRTVRRRRFRGR
nr:hypothetical protein [Streptomyces prasinopilosus]